MDNKFYKLLKYNYRMNLTNDLSLKKKYNDKVEQYKKQIGGDEPEITNKINDLIKGAQEFSEMFNNYKTDMESKLEKAVKESSESQEKEIAKMKEENEQLMTQIKESQNNDEKIKEKDNKINELDKEIENVKKELNETNSKMKQIKELVSKF